MPKGVYIRTEEIRRKMSERMKNYVIPPEVRAKMRIGILKNPGRPWLGKKMSEEHRRKIGEAGKGRKMSEESRKKLSEAKKGSKSYMWKGGITSESMKVRNSFEYKLWRSAVYARDKWTCVWCGKVGGRLNADHIKSFSQHPELRFDIDNGRTLCVPCHQTTENYGGKSIRLHLSKLKNATFEKMKEEGIKI